MKTTHNNRFPGESKEYRTARNALLRAEIKLRKQTEEVAKLRRKLPSGGKVKEDYVFEEIDKKTGKIKKTKLSELFTRGKDSLIIYSFMYAPEDETPCVLCNSIIDGINGMIFHVNERTNFVMVAKAPIKKLVKWGKSRGWKNVRMLSSFNNSYNTDYFTQGKTSKEQLPALNVFRKKGKNIYHFYSTELLYLPVEKGQDGRHVDSIWPLWNLFDFLPEGRGTDWYPKHSYR